MDKIIPISDLQTKTKECVEAVKQSRDSLIITQRGRPAAMVVNYEEYQSLIQTIDEMSYPDWKEKLDEAEKASKLGRGISLEKFKKKIKKLPH